MSEAAQEKPKKEPYVYYDVAKTLHNVEMYLRKYNEDKDLKEQIRVARVPILLRIYRLALSKHNSKSKDVKTITTQRRNDEGESYTLKTLGFVTKEQSIATHLQCNSKTIQRSLKVLTGEVAKRANVTPPALLEYFETSCYGLTLLLNPSFLVPLERKEKDLGTV